MTPDLSTRYLGLDLKSPLVASACPLTGDLAMLKRVEEAGVGAVVLPSVFEEQIREEELNVDTLFRRESSMESVPARYFPDLEGYNTGLSAYLRLVEKARATLGIPVIASLNGSGNGAWVRFAKCIEEAGAHALELNLDTVAARPEQTGQEVEQMYTETVKSVVAATRLPVAVKVGPYFSAFARTARDLEHAGASGIVIFNRFPQPDIDVRKLVVTPTLKLSTSSECLLPLRWIGILSGTLKGSLAATTGLHTWEDVAKVILAGADVAMVASAFIKKGAHVFRTFDTQLRSWMEEHDWESLKPVRGLLSRTAAPDPSAFDRTSYLKAIASFQLV
jgi:dihydroorotate dehydrogenase (fumarate)